MYPVLPPPPAWRRRGQPFPTHPSASERCRRPLPDKTKRATSLPKLGREEQLRRASAQARTYSSTIRWTEDEQLHMELTDAPLVVLNVSKIMQVVTLLVRSKRPAFITDKTRLGGHQQAMTPLGKAFIELMGSSYREEAIRDEFPEHAFHPLVELFWKHSAALQPFSGRCRSEPAALEACFAAMREESASKGFGNRRKAHAKIVRQNTDSLLSYIDDLFDLWGRMLVIRIDVGHRRARTGKPRTPTVTPELANRLRGQLLAYARSKHFPATLRGYAWSLENGRATSWHQHLLLFFDGGTSCRDVQLAKMLGEHWRTVLTGGEGCYYNCNADEHARLPN